MMHLAAFVRNWLLPASALALVMASSGSSMGQTGWFTTDDFQLVPGKTANAEDMGTDSSGNILAVGTGSDGVKTHGIVRRSTDGGNTWSIIHSAPDFYPRAVGNDSSGNLFVLGNIAPGLETSRWGVMRRADSGSSWFTVDDFQYVAGKNSWPDSFGKDSLGNLYAAGLGNDASGTGGQAQHWIVRRSQDGGTTWATVDDFKPFDWRAEAHAIANNSSAVFVAGLADKGSGQNRGNHWIVRKSADGGCTWITVDDFQLSANKSANARALAADSLGNLYAAGWAFEKGQNRNWIVRKMANFGGTWSTVDRFQYLGKNSSQPATLGIDGSGKIYTAGYGSDNTGLYHWLTRRSLDGGSTWALVDDFQHTPGQNSKADGGFASDPSGNIFIGGGGTDSSGKSRWIVRKLPAALAFARSVEAPFLRGDANVDGAVDISDASYTLEYLFLGTSTLGCLAAANANGDGDIDISDPIGILEYLFIGGPAPVAPYPKCGPGTLLVDEELGWVGCMTPPKTCP